MKINDFGEFRYSITNLPNDELKHFAVLGLSKLKMAMTYEMLIKVHIAQLKETTNSASPEQVARNHLTALRTFLKSIQKFESSPIGAELSDEFDAAMKKHLEEANLSSRSQSDRKSLLCAWRKTFISTGETPVLKIGRERRTSPAVASDQNAFQRVLWEGLKSAKLAPKTAAKRSGTSTSAIARWTNGALPNMRTQPTFEKLEKTLGMAQGVLLDAFNQATGKNSNAQVNAFRQRLKVQGVLKYRLQEVEVSARLFDEWEKFFDFKTSKIDTALVRPRKSRWSLVELRHATVERSTLWARGNRVCPTAKMAWQRLFQFFGFLRLPQESGGYGLADGDAQTLAWLAVPEAIEAFLNFQTERSDGLMHGSQKGFAAFVMSLVHPIHGYLTQSSYLQANLPQEATAKRTWERMCNETMQVASAWKAESHDKSRDPSEPIQFLLDLEEPLAPIFSAMQKLRRIGNGASPNSLQEACARRNELLLGLLLSNPLRCKNLITLTYNANNTGNVYQSTTGQWRIRIGGNLFKNRNRVGSKVYDVPVARWLQPLLSDYVRYTRPILCKGAAPEYFFLTQRGGRLNTLGRQVTRTTKLFIPGCSGFGPHAFRHLVATDWLTKNHNDFLTVAELLNDTIKVVMDTYAHLKKDVAFNRFEAYVQRLLPAEMAL